MLMQVAADQVNQVIDKLAEKIGVAATELAPLAEETVRQVSMRGIVFMASAVAGMILAYVFYRLTIGAVKKAKQASDSEPAEMGYIVGAFFSGVTAITFLIGGFVVFFEGLSMYLAPIPYLLGL